MDRKLAEFHFMGIFDIYREAYKVTLSWKKIFSQIALAQTLSSAIISALALNAINQSNLQNQDLTQMGNPKYTGNLKTRFASEMIIFNVSKAIYGLCSIILSLFMTSAVVYTVACVYCSKDITFKKVISAVPKLWKRLMITFLWFLLIQFVYFFIMSIVAALLMLLLVVSGILSVDKLGVKSTNNMSVLGIILAIPIMIGFIYISFIWYMAAVVSILEDIRGIKAIKKGKNLIKGKIWIVFATYILLQICNTGTRYAFSSLVHGGSLAMVFQVSLRIFCLLLQGIFIHFGLVIQTIIYFVCKSHHKENIDKSSLGDHLDGYHLGQNMDRKSEEFESMGIFDIYREAYKVTMSQKKIFSQIALALILPLAFILLAQIETAELLSNKIFSNLKTVDDNLLHSQVSSDLIIFYVFISIYMLFTSVLSLLATSVIVYTVAYVYSSKDINFKKVMSVVPKVWKRLMITFLWKLLVLFVYNVIIVLVIILLAILYVFLSKILSVHIYKSAVIIFVILMTIFIIIGAMCITLVWFLASVISILEDIRGIEAMKKGKNLIKGKIRISWRIYFTFQSCCAAVQFAFRYQDSLALVGRVSLGISCLLLLVIFIHFGIVTQTIVYFVCKSHHKENIDKSSLADHLDGYYLGYYVPLNEDANLHLEGNSV
ncbi:hypothetical protein MKX03_023623 [Papaver bracteatum]|nr:hypothetical protein MKX03_023623 [Papaver bracteatum]